MLTNVTPGVITIGSDNNVYLVTGELLSTVYDRVALFMLFLVPYPKRFVS
jgi:hypothetical protein